MAKLIFTTLGSAGDINPCIRLGAELSARGHEVIVATSLTHRGVVARSGLAFVAVPPDLGPETPNLIEVVLDRRHGPERLQREYLLPSLEEGMARLDEVVAEPVNDFETPTVSIY